MQRTALAEALAYPELTGVLRSDPARLIAQVVSGIGFLGSRNHHRYQTQHFGINDRKDQFGQSPV
ncbi:hypothetical protein MGH68_05135 [Erysipelothrix sp. D19-032]